MKKFLAVAALMAVSSVNAEELKFGDLNYFLKQGQFNLKADLNLTRENTDVDDVKYEVEGYVASTKLYYGLTDKLNLFVGANYLYDMETNPASNQTSTVDGLQNPMVGVDFRVMEQSNADFNLDVGAVVDLNIMDQEIAELGKENGTIPSPLLSYYGDPRSSLELNARLGKKYNEANEFYALAAVIYNKDGEYEDKNSIGDTNVELDSSVDFKLGGFYQYRPVNEFMMTFGLVGTRFGETEGEAAGQDFTVGDHIDFTFTFNAKYLITDTFIAKFNFSQDNRDEEFEVERGGAITKYDHRRGNSYGVGIDWLF